MTSLMTSDQRVWTTLNHEEPDRIPIYEGAIEPASLNRRKKMKHADSGILFMFSPKMMHILTKSWASPFIKIAEKMLGKPQFLYPFIKPALYQYTKLARSYGVDLITIIGGLPMVFSPRIFQDFTSKGGTIYAPNKQIVMDVPSGGGAVSRSGFLRSEADYEKYIQFDPDHPANHVLVKHSLDAAKGKFALAISVYGAAFFEYLCEMFGLETLFRLMIKSPRFIDRVVKDMASYSLNVLEIQANLGVQLVYMSDDLGQIGRSMISPSMYQRFFHTGVKKFVERAHKLGIKVMRHSDGNINDLLPFFIEEGIDALHPWESDAGMDIFAGKRQWGTKLTLIGNVPIPLLSQGTPHQTVDYVKRLCKECGPGGGYIIASSHSIVHTVQWQNYIAMLWAAKKYGQYPINR